MLLVLDFGSDTHSYDSIILTLVMMLFVLDFGSDTCSYDLIILTLVMMRQRFELLVEFKFSLFSYLALDSWVVKVNLSLCFIFVLCFGYFHSF